MSRIFPPDPSRPPPPRRCKNCFYILENLDTDRCPECGRFFDPSNSITYTLRPPFIWWTFWLPAFILAVTGGLILYVLLIPIFGYGGAVGVAIPFAIGGVIGYGAKTSAPGSVFLGWFAVISCVAVLIAGGVVGNICGLVLAGIALIPVAVGAVLGWILRMSLLISRFSQRDYLRMFFLQVLILLIPVFIAVVEGRHDALPIVTISTNCQINQPPQIVWRSIQFYEQVHRPTPWLLRISPEVRPLFTSGRSESVGDIRKCIYEQGRLIKMVTQVQPNRRLAFRVIRQDQVEVRSILLIDGSFDLLPQNDGRETKLVLTTRYRPLLYPRFAYAWAERWFTHTLHHHVMAGMADTANELAAAAVAK